jgi:hypothetical protein
MFEKGGPSVKAPVVVLSSSSDDEGLIPETSRDFEFAQRLYDELNRALLGPPDDGKVIVISDSDKETEAREETLVEAEVVPSTAAGKPSTPAASHTDANENPGAAPNYSSDGLAPGPKMRKDSDGGDKASAP